jgi:murein DD-endopeptidase MepM/ murein hydrolase activator NlpD
MPLDNKISNILGVRIPEWLYQQLQTRSSQNSQGYRDNNNLVYLANKTAWVRLVSSINITDPRDRDYFRNLGADVTADENSLAQQFTLFGGTTVYLNNKNNLRAGLGKGGSYGLLGDTEIQKYGYRPMPGITNVTIETKGRLGSVREAVVNFKCFDKDQLDIIDALYFKLGYSMFLEWGHTYYYPSPGTIANPSKYDPTKVRSTEFYTINPFEANLTKEEILRRISQNSRDSEGNYDAMLGIVTNFNFSFNQDGAYDCTLRIAALGSLGDSIKINNPSNLPDVLKGTIKKYNSVLEEIARAKAAKQDQETKKQLLRQQNITYNWSKTDSNGIIQEGKFKGTSFESYKKTYNVTPEEEQRAKLLVDNRDKEFTAQQLIDRYLEIDTQKNVYKYKGTSEEASVSYPSNAQQTLENADIYIGRDQKSLLIRRLKALIPDNVGDRKVANITLDTERLLKIINVNFLNELSQDQNWDVPGQVNRAVTFDENEIERFNKIRVYRGQVNNFPYLFYVDRTTYAKTTKKSVIEEDQLIRIDTKTFADEFLNYLKSNNTLKLSSIQLDIFDADRGISGIGQNNITNEELQKGNPWSFTVKFNITITKPAKVFQEVTNNVGRVVGTKIITEDATYKIPVTFKFTDTSLIRSVSIDKVTQPIDYLDYEKNLKDQDTGQSEENQASPQDANSEQTESPLSNLSSLELILRTIQVHSLSEAIRKSGFDLEIGRQVQPIPLVGEDGNTEFINQIFSNGVFTPFINELISGNIPDTEYDNINNTNSDYRFKVQSKYGFATNLMANREKLYENATTFNLRGSQITLPQLNFSPVNYKKLLKSYVVPYDISQEIESGTQLNHPVYIPFGTLLMILNHSATIYDVKSDGESQKPLIYIDFNPNHSYCLSNPNQLSTDPWTCLIPFEGKTDDYRKLFDENILTEDKTAIAPLTDSEQSTPLFDPRSDVEDSRDNLSGAILPFKYDEESSPYRGKIMNILLNIDYLMNTIKMFSTKNDENKVFLKPFLEQIIIDISKSIGNFNVFRLSYNDAGNTYQITDDQIVPPQDKEVMLELTADNNATLPLFGKTSIAKSIDIKTEISTKLSNMLAISVNAETGSKSTLSTNGDSFGFINTNYVDRYIQNRKEPSQQKDKETPSDGLKNTAIQFNSAIESFYNSIAPSQQYVGMATNYFINKITKIKGNEPPTRASAMIPVSVNFTTDGISGFNMGHAFTLPNELIPYTYSSRIFSGEKDHINRVGFVVVGLSHTIENNSWNTAVKANMIFLKDRSMFNLEKDKEYKRQEAGRFGGELNGSLYHGEVTDLNKASRIPRNVNKSKSATANSTSNFLFGSSKPSINSTIKTKAHGAREANQVGQWQSSNAWDLFVDKYTPIYAIFDGTINNINYLEQGNFIWGYRFTLIGNGNSAWYTHLDRVVVSNGAKVKRGDLLGFVGEPPRPDFEWPIHLHIALEQGNLSDYLGSGGQFV